MTQARFEFDNGNARASLDNPTIDEGNGKLRFRGMLGIYQQDGERIFICLGVSMPRQRPAFFRASNGQHLLILHRAKPRK